MSLGLFDNWLDVEPIDVAIKYVHKRNKELGDENRDRRNIFYQWRGLGVQINSMPLRYLWQVWEIPEIDGDITKTIHYTKIRNQTDEEKRLLKERPKGWERKLLEINDRNKRSEGD